VIQPEAQSPKPKVNLYGWWLRPAVSLGLYVLIFYYWVDLRTTITLLRSSDLRFVFLGVLLYCAGQLASAYRWLLLLRPVQLTSSYARLAGFYFIGMFFSIFLPTIVGGDAVKAILLVRETGAPARATISVFMDRNVGLFALLAIAIVAAWSAPTIDRFRVSLFVLTSAAGVVYLVANVALMNARAYGMVDRLIALTPLADIRHRASSLYEAVVPYRHHPGTLAGALALSFLHQAVVIGVVFLNARALGQSFPIPALAVFVPLVALAGMVPFSMNGMGVRDAMYVLLFGQLGASEELALSLALLHLAVTFLASLPGGLVYALQKTPARQEGAEVP
jgi:glycosyltransferase 2 family protein